MSYKQSKLRTFLERQNKNLLLLGYVAASQGDPRVITEARGKDYFLTPISARLKEYKSWKIDQGYFRSLVKQRIGSSTPKPGRLK